MHLPALQLLVSTRPAAHLSTYHSNMNIAHTTAIVRLSLWWLFRHTRAQVLHTKYPNIMKKAGIYGTLNLIESEPKAKHNCLWFIALVNDVHQFSSRSCRRIRQMSRTAGQAFNPVLTSCCVVLHNIDYVITPSAADLQVPYLWGVSYLSAFDCSAFIDLPV